MTDITKQLKKAFPEVSTALQRNRDGKAYFSFGLSSHAHFEGFTICSAIGMWLRDNVDKDAYMTSGGGSGGTFRLPKFTVVKTPPKADTIEVVRDRYGKSIQVGSRVAFNYCGDVALGTVVTVERNKMPRCFQERITGKAEWARQTNLHYTFHVARQNRTEISKVKNKGSIVVI